MNLLVLDLSKNKLKNDPLVSQPNDISNEREKVGQSQAKLFEWGFES